MTESEHPERPTGSKHPEGPTDPDSTGRSEAYDESLADLTGEEPTEFEGYRTDEPVPEDPAENPMGEEPVDPLRDPDFATAAEGPDVVDVPTDAYEGSFPPEEAPSGDSTEQSPTEPGVEPASTYGAATDGSTTDAADIEAADEELPSDAAYTESATGSEQAATEDLSPDFGPAEEQASDPAEEAQFTERPLMADDGGLGSESVPGHPTEPTPEEDEGAYASSDEPTGPTDPQAAEPTLAADEPTPRPGEPEPMPDEPTPASPPTPDSGEPTKRQGDPVTHPEPPRREPSESDKKDPTKLAFWKNLFS